jgi:hypothetical protein
MLTNRLACQAGPVFKKSEILNEKIGVLRPRERVLRASGGRNFASQNRTHGKKKPIFICKIKGLE